MSSLCKSFQAIDSNQISTESESNSSVSSSECVHSTATDPSSAIDDFGKTLLNRQPSPAVVLAADSSSNSNSNSSSQMLQGIRNDLAEIGDGLINGFSILSLNSRKAVGEISRFTSNLLPFQRRLADDGEDDEDDEEEFEDEFIDDTPGITDEVLNFVADISLRPEYWTPFSLALDDTDFEMTEVQRKHTSTVEELIPNISALKVQLQSQISNELFWMTYFILVLPRFNQDDFELLVTPEIVEAQNLLQEKFQREEKSHVKSEDTWDNNLVSVTQNGNIQSEEKANSTEVTEGGEGLEIQDGDEMNTNQRLKMEDSKTCEDVKQRDGLEGNPFSDIEDDWTNLSGRFTNPSRTSSSTGSSDWVKLHEILDFKLDKLKTWKQDRDSEAEYLTDWSNMDGFY